MRCLKQKRNLHEPPTLLWPPGKKGKASEREKDCMTVANMWFSLLVVVLNLLLVHGKKAPLPHTKCERTFEKVGCFKDNTKKGMRTLPNLLVNDRDKNSDAHDGHKINWHEWEESMLSLACRCANATREKGWKVFGLQFYGECWSGENGETAFNKYGEADPKKCIQELVDPMPPCDKNKDMECVGVQSTNYLYRLKDCKCILLTLFE
ncbi:hypothetical protein OS493_021803 [Desmophyllum pertusum]|uniref:Uncharacterized protein n=1 Tax=Desmophyllum pertusum TaxID=174260 RepID=A0A9W9ZN22_9CNID|nr:hypothetical protein OS493_021803 [Desmophyllum pertusum]